MICSLAVILIGVVALVKGELNITSKRKVTSTVSRILAGVLIGGSIIGAFTGWVVTLITFVMVIGLGLVLLEDTSKPEDLKDKQVEPIARPIPPPTAPTIPIQSNHSISPPAQPWNSNSVDLSSLMPSPPPQQEVYEPMQKYYPYMDFTDTINAPITGTTFISAATRVDTYPVHSDFLVYDIKAAYTKKPGQPILCPKCGGLLKAVSIQPSLGVRKDLDKIDLAANHRFSILFNCKNCQWWCLRENWKSVIRQSYVYDYLVAGGIPVNTSGSIKYNEIANPKNPEPWAKALIFRDIYDYSEKLPENLKIIFPRSQ